MRCLHLQQGQCPVAVRGGAGRRGPGRTEPRADAEGVEKAEPLHHGPAETDRRIEEQIKTEMKRNFFIILVVCMAMTACEEKEPVHPGDLFSLHGYNLPEVVVDYFHAHEDEMALREGDTIRLTGWTTSDNVENAMRTYYINYWGQMFLTSHPDHTFHTDSIIGIYEPMPDDDSLDICFVDHFEEWVHNRLYIIGKIRVRELIDSMDYSNHDFFSSNQPQSKGYRLITVEAIDVDVNPI